MLRADNEIARDVHKYSAARIVRQRERRRQGIDDATHLAAVRGAARALPEGARLRTEDGQAGAEQQHLHEGTKGPASPIATPDGVDAGHSDRRLDLKEETGPTRLGLTTNRIWHEDPRRLVFLLARYKFAAKMLKDRRFVGEVGCGDAFGARIVLQEVGALAVYDADPVLIEDVRLRRSERWPIDAYVHNIVMDPLPNKHDAIYSFDAIERVRREDEHAYISNLRDSLEDNGVLIIGTSSAQSQVHSAPQGHAGPVNCRSGMELKALLESYFDRTFMFSMNDEIVHPGFHPLADYLFAICTGPICTERAKGDVAGEPRAAP